jgi:hypothetical protein
LLSLSVEVMSSGGVIERPVDHRTVSRSSTQRRSYEEEHWGIHIWFIIGARGVVGEIIASTAMLRTGIASADCYAGIIYSEAVGGSSASERKLIVTSIVGGRTPLDDCIARRQDHPDLVTHSRAGQVIGDRPI